MGIGYTSHPASRLRLKSIFSQTLHSVIDGASLEMARQTKGTIARVRLEAASPSKHVVIESKFDINVIRSTIRQRFKRSRRPYGSHGRIVDGADA